MAYPSTVANIEARMRALVSHPGCTLQVLPHHTHEGRQVFALRIAGTPPDPAKPVVMIIAGVHAREWLPPDAVLSFVEKLLHAHASGVGMRYPLLRDGNARYGSWWITRNWVKKFLRRAELIAVPLANPDGRQHSLSALRSGRQFAEWRGNRNLHAVDPGTGVSGLFGCPTHGVDLNRNFDWQWDPNPYYTAADEHWIETNVATETCDLNPQGQQIYRGASAASEPETRNIQELIDADKPDFFMDVHSSGRVLLVPYGTAPAQHQNRAASVRNAALNRSGIAGSGRSVVSGGYEEFMPLSAMRWRDRLTRRIVGEILRHAGGNRAAKHQSVYRPVEICKFIFANTVGGGNAPIPGSSVDYAFNRPNRTGGNIVYACGLECGSALNGELGFFPPAGVKYQKIEREVHTAIEVILKSASGHRLPVHVIPPP